MNISYPLVFCSTSLTTRLYLLISYLLNGQSGVSPNFEICHLSCLFQYPIEHIHFLSMFIESNNRPSFKCIFFPYNFYFFTPNYIPYIDLNFLSITIYPLYRVTRWILYNSVEIVLGFSSRSDTSAVNNPRNEAWIYFIGSRNSSLILISLDTASLIVIYVLILSPSLLQLFFI